MPVSRTAGGKLHALEEGAPYCVIKKEERIAAHLAQKTSLFEGGVCRKADGRSL